MKINESPKREPIRLRNTGIEEPVVSPSDSRVGVVLRRVREEKGLSLEDISKALKIRVSLLEDMEKGNMDEMPVQAFSVGFLKLYIRHLGIADEAALVAQFVSQMKPQENKLAYYSPPLTSPNRPGTTLVVGGTLLFMLCFAGYEFYFSKMPNFSIAELREQLGLSGLGSNRDPVETPAKKTPPDPQPLTEETLVLPPPVIKPVVPPKTEVVPVVVKRVEGVATPSPVVNDKPAVVVPPHVLSEPTIAKKIEEPPPPEEEEGEGATQGKTPVGSEKPMIVAVEKVWVQIKNKHRVIVKELVLKEGETFTIDGEDFNSLTVGNAGGVRLRMGSQDSQPLGPKGKVLRNMDLSMSSIKKALAKRP